jgi:hypothetical protein
MGEQQRARERKIWHLRLLHLKTKGGGWIFDDGEAAAVEHSSDNLSSKLGEIQNQRDGEART